MVDFAKLKVPTERVEYLYRCRRCGEETWYLVNLDQVGMTDGHRKNGWGQRCNGQLKLLETRTTKLGK